MQQNYKNRFSYVGLPEEAGCLRAQGPLLSHETVSTVLAHRTVSNHSPPEEGESIHGAPSFAYKATVHSLLYFQRLTRTSEKKARREAEGENLLRWKQRDLRTHVDSQDVIRKEKGGILGWPDKRYFEDRNVSV